MYKAVILSLLLTGCAAKTVPVLVSTPVFHPSMPVPYVVCPVTWEVLEDNGRAKVAVSYNDNITVAICNKDIERYISQLLNITCHYRRDLKERICVEHKK